MPRVAVSGNAGVRTREVVKAARPGSAKLGLYKYDRPPYRPERNRFAPLFKQLKRHERPARSFTTRADLRKAVEDGSETYRRPLRAKGDNELRLAA
ncbi:MAG: hypothetical protein J0I06_09630 [Planctomycetes bacterium]|nr:hypothetical protein [Planctomycetota bacterium]